jgi:probable HAF family extracellular repeat protein
MINRVSFLVVLTALQAAALSGESFGITNLGSLGGRTTMPAAINNTGQVVGYSQLAGTIAGHAFLYSDGKMMDLGTLGGSNSSALGINSSGQIVGVSDVVSFPLVRHPFLYSAGTMTDLGTLGGPEGEAEGINASGQIVGTAQPNATGPWNGFLYSGGTMMDLGSLSPSEINDSGQIAGIFAFSGTPETGQVTHAFLYSGGVMMDLGSLGGHATYTTGINNAGQIVGYSYTPDDHRWHAFLYSEGTMMDLGTLNGGPFSEAWGINASGQVVGNSTAAPGSTPRNGDHAILYSGGIMYDLETLVPANTGWQLINATAINDVGQIVGWGFYKGEEAAFLLTPQAPVPEPGYWPLLLACVAVARLVPRSHPRSTL